MAVKTMEIQSGKNHIIFYQFDQFLWETGHECCKLRPFFQRFFHCRATLFLCKVVQPADSATEVCRSCGLHSQALGTTQRLNSALQMSGFHKSQILLFICGKSHPRLQAWMKYDEIDMMKYENIQNSDHQTAISAGGINGVLRGAVAQRRRRRRRRRCWQWTGWKCGETAF